MMKMKKTTFFNIRSARETDKTKNKSHLFTVLSLSASLTILGAKY